MVGYGANPFPSLSLMEVVLNVPLGTWAVKLRLVSINNIFSLKSEFLQTSMATSENFIFEKIKSLSLFRELLFRFKLSTTQ